MSVESPQRPRRRSEARERLLATASRLFYTEGIGGVGVDRIVKEAQVTLATFYRHFPSKDALVVAYLDGVHELIVQQTESATAGHHGAEVVRALGDLVIAEMGHQGFRGCAFINAASEFEDPQSDVRQAVARHRQWYLETIRGAFAGAGHPQAGNVARHFIMLRDGAMAGGSLDSATVAKRTFKRGVDGLVRTIDTAPSGTPTAS